MHFVIVAYSPTMSYFANMTHDFPKQGAWVTDTASGNILSPSDEDDVEADSGSDSDGGD